jgi:hypothetical protein
MQYDLELELELFRATHGRIQASPRKDMEKI